MRHWLVMFRPETYSAAREHGLMAVLNQHHRRFAEIAPGDRFVAYISRQRILDAHGEVTGEPFQEVSDTPAGWKRYTERAKVRFDQTGAGIDARELLWGLSFVDDKLKTEPANYLMVKGGFLEIPESDYQWLRDVMSGKAPISAARTS